MRILSKPRSSIEGTNVQVGQLIESGEFGVIQLQYSLFFQHPYDPDKHAGQMLDAEAKGLGIAVVRPLAGDSFPRWIRQVYPGVEE